MKTLNRTLSLVLVLVMVLGLFGIASAAKLGDFEDKGDVTYTEAVDYLTAAGVVAGDTATTINPQGDLTREQAAKLIAYAMLGQVAADNLKATSDPFTDVAASRWSAGYIAYCQKQGVINGLGNGTFAPEDKVTGYQYAKMLLCAIGFGVNDEFTGNGWELETARLALAYGIFAGNTKGASNEAANREEAFLYTFNTLSTLRTVSYNSNLGVYYVPGSGALSTNPQSANLIASPYSSTNDTRLDTVGAIKFGISRQHTTDDFSNSAHEWVMNKVAVTDTYSNDDIKVLATITDGTLVSDAVRNTSAKYVAAASSNGIAYFYNGAQVADFDPAVAVAAGDLVEYNNTLYVITTGYGPAAWNAGNAAEYSVKGATVKLMAGTGVNANKVEKVSIIEKTVGAVTADPVKTTTGSVTTVRIPGVVNTATNIKKVEYPSDLAKDDVVLYYTAGGVTYVEKATALTGDMTGYVLDGLGAIARVTVGTDNAYVSELVDNGGNTVIDNGLITGFLNQTGYTYYIDDNGYLCYFVQADDAKTLSNVMYVRAAGSAGLNGNTEFAYVTSEGIIATAEASTTGVTPSAGSFYTASKLADGSYKLTNIAATQQGQFASAALANNAVAYSITGKQIKFLTVHTASAEADWAAVTDTAPAQVNSNDVTGNSSTIFMYYNAASKTYTVKTGVVNALDYDVSDTTNVDVYTDANGVALLVVASGSTSSITSSANTIFPISATQVGYEASTGLNTYTFYAYVNGATTPAPVVSYAPISLGNLYYVTSYAANGYPQTVEEAVDLVQYASNTLQGRALTDGKLNIAVGNAATTTEWSKGILNISGAKVAENKAIVASPAGSYVVPSTATVYVVDARDTSNITYTTGDPSSINALEYTGATAVGVISIEASDTDSTISSIYLLIK